MDLAADHMLEMMGGWDPSVLDANEDRRVKTTLPDGAGPSFDFGEISPDIGWTRASPMVDNSVMPSLGWRGEDSSFHPGWGTSTMASITDLGPCPSDSGPYPMPLTTTSEVHPELANSQGWGSSSAGDALSIGGFSSQDTFCVSPSVLSIDAQHSHVDSIPISGLGVRSQTSLHSTDLVALGSPRPSSRKSGNGARKGKNVAAHTTRVEHTRAVKQCTVCGVVKKAQKDLRRHYKVHHRETAIQMGIDVSRFSCRYCKETIGRKDNRRRHEKSKHGR